MCPLEVRGLAAAVHNLAWRVRAYPKYSDSPCKLIEKFQNMKIAAERVVLDSDAPAELKRLHEVALTASKCATVSELLKHGDALQAASDAVQHLCDKHFENRAHSHGL